MRILAVGAHPDDIEPQMGGTIAKLVENGHEVLVLQATDTGNVMAKIRTQESIDAVKILGAQIKHLNYNQNDFQFDRKIVQSIDKVINYFKPHEIYTCNEQDSHQDHQIISKAVVAASRKNSANLFYFEPILPGGITPYGFQCNYYVDISNTIDKKMNSVLAHSSQITKFGNEWIEAIRGRAKFRGFQINVAYAEAFKVVKFLDWIR